MPGEELGALFIPHFVVREGIVVSKNEKQCQVQHESYFYSEFFASFI